jgi:hypothetical protein
MNACGCPPSETEIERAMEMSLRWAERCKTAFGDQPGKAMFGIVQGGDAPKLRERSAQGLSGLDLKGYAVGGLAVGEPQDVMLDMLDVTCPLLPGQTALPDGRRHARRHPQVGRPRHRHVRLRDADPCRPARAGVHAPRQDQPEECAPRRGSPAAGRAKVHARPRATIPAPTCTIWCAQTRFSA